MSLYLDTSCLLKLIFREPESAATAALVAREDRVLVSSLARLEALVQIQGRLASGLLTASDAGALGRQIDAVLAQSPHELARLPAGVEQVAEAQMRPLRTSTYCRTLDRLHLAGMEILGLRRLLTNDGVQATAARALGYEILMPR